MLVHTKPNFTLTPSWIWSIWDHVLRLSAVSVQLRKYEIFNLNILLVFCGGKHAFTIVPAVKQMLPSLGKRKA